MKTISLSYLSQLYLYYFLAIHPALMLLIHLGAIIYIPIGFISFGLVIFCFILQMILILSRKLNARFVLIDFFVFLFLFSILCISIMNFHVFSLQIGEFEALSDIGINVLFPAMIFFVLKYCGTYENLIHNKKKITLIWLAVSFEYLFVAAWGMFLSGSINPLDASLRYLNRELFSGDNANNNYTGYLALGDTYALFSILTITLYKKGTAFSAICWFSVYILYVVGSRASFLFFVLTLLAHQMTRNYFNKIFWVKACCSVIIIGIVIGGAYALLESVDIASSQVNEMLGLIINPENDTSYRLREEIRNENLKIIQTSPLLGDFRHEIFDERSTGYTHSVLSYWEQYGIIVFLLLLGIYSYMLFQTIRLYMKHDTILANFAFMALVFWGLNMIFARAYVFQEFQLFVLGISSALISQGKH